MALPASPAKQPSKGASSDSALTGAASNKPSPASERKPGDKPIVLGICSMDIKARSKAMREILTRLVEIEGPGLDIKIFGDKVILDDDIHHWPQTDILISFFSTDFPLPKAIAYTQLSTQPPPIVINDLPMQSVLWDRRLVLAILDHIGVPTPRRMEVSRDGGPKPERVVKEKVKRELGLEFTAWEDKEQTKKADVTKGEVVRGTDVSLREDGDAIIVNGQVMEKPFVEKPVNGEDHNVYIYYKGGGGRRLFRKVGNKSSESDPTLMAPRTEGSYIYEEFINVENAEDIKIYTVGPHFSHAETRKSPVVDGLVRRNTDGKEIRFITKLSDDEKSYASRICDAFGQMVCGFDLLRCEDEGGRSLVIDVNGWSFVKGNQAYYDRAAEILSHVCERARKRRAALANLALAVPKYRGLIPNKTNEPTGSSSSTSTLKASVTVFRHSDRTPKMKSKFNFTVGEPWAAPFVSLLRGYREEIVLRESKQLDLILAAAAESIEIGCPEDVMEKLVKLQDVLQRKKELPGTKAQLKPTFPKDKSAPKVKEKDDHDDDGSTTETEDRIRKWIATGEMRTNQSEGDSEVERLESVEEEPSNSGGSGPGSVSDKATAGTADSADQSSVGLTRTVSRQGSRRHNPSFPAPHGLEKVQLVVKWGGESTHAARYQSKDLGENMKKDIKIMNSSILKNVKIYTSSERRVINTADIFARALLDKENIPPESSRFLERPPLVDHLIQRRDLLDDSNAAKSLMDGVKKKLKILLRPGESDRRPGLYWPKELKKEPVQVVREVVEMMTDLRATLLANFQNQDVDKIQSRWCSGDSPSLFKERWEKLFEDWVGVKQEKFDPSRVSELYDSLKYDSLHNRVFLFAIFDPQCGKDLNAPQDRKLHELVDRAKLLFDLVAPQEYGIEPEEKEEIGILTSLPLLKKVIQDLEHAKASDESHASFYFTKESHIYTFCNLVLAAGLPMDKKKKIPELDYASHITFELYERSYPEEQRKDFSLSIAISEGAHSPAVLDSSVDARHSLNVQARKKLTSHIPYEQAMTALKRYEGKAIHQNLSFSTTPLEGEAIYFDRDVKDELVLPLSSSRYGEVPSSASSDRASDTW
ncbi:actin cytoskeleton organization and biogenesis-related protein [Phaffia rhodozyma]|uniref:Inositol hexakisphosphate and diphosphoinositol-pentakisphosphate kinase n=1 Tax=Phaffia rhodozyma TaxID=264483 RepID=A0A0F7SLM3_PHARH|nr:actin cytoskeleton organization and biogenesis-related protein [Phaffia rhodozyma]